MAKFWQFQGNGASVIEQMRRQITKDARTIEAQAATIAEREDWIPSLPPETDGERATRLMHQSVALFAPQRGQRHMSTDEAAAYVRALHDLGQPVPVNLRATHSVPVDFTLTDGVFVHWTDPAYPPRDVPAP